MEAVYTVFAVLGVVMIFSALWRPFKAAALLMEAKARYYNALAGNEEQKPKR